MKRSLSSQAAFTLLEMMLVVAIIALLAGSVIMMIGGELEEAREVRAEADIKGLGTALYMYNAKQGGFPTTEQGLQALVPKQMKELPVDGWSMPYHYESPGKHNPDSFDLYSSGKDRIPGTSDDIGNWKKPKT